MADATALDNTVVDDTNKPVTDEIATAVKNFFEPVYNGLLSPNDDTLVSRGGGKGLRIYDEIERDPHAFSVLQKRKLALISREWDVMPGGKRAIDKAAAETVKRQLLAMPFDGVCVGLMDAILKGFSVGEVIWEIVGGEIIARDIRARSQRRFVFDVESRLRMLTQHDAVYGIALPARKFLVHRYGAKDGNPYGLGLGTRLFWPVFFKRKGIQFWLTFADKFGNPTLVGKYPVGASDTSKRTLRAALQAISQESTVSLPTGFEISLLEAQRSGSVTTYESLCRYLDEEISKAVLGETMSTSGHGSGGLGSNQASVQNAVRLEIVKADADLLSSSFQPLCHWVTQYNHPGAATPRVTWDVSEPADVLNRAQADQIVFNMGFQPDLGYIQSTYGSGWTVRAIAPPLSQSTTGVQFAAPMSNGDRINTYQTQLATASDSTILAWAAVVRKLVDQALDLNDLRDKLIQAYPQLSLNELAQGMEAAFTAAQLAGRYDILQQAGA